MGIVRLMAKGAAHDLAETHPQLRSLRNRLVEKYNLHPDRARRLVVSLIEHVANDLGDSYLGEMGTRLRKIDTIRGRIAGAIDHVVAEGTLPAELDKAALTGLFDDLEKEMAELRSVSNFAKGHEAKLSFKPEDPKFDAGPFGTSRDPLQGHVASTPTAPLRDAMAAMESSSPARARAFLEVLDTHGDELGQAVLATTETTQNSALKKLKEALGPDFPPQKFEELSAAVKELSMARHKASIGPGSATARVRADRLARLPDELGEMALGDNTILGPLAEQHPQGLRELWDAWNAGGRTGGGGNFRNYVYGEMRSGTRPYLAEFETAHGLGSHGFGLLKDPASFDPRLPNMRRINPREGGTDLIGLREDGEIWVVDDKSHRLSKAQVQAGVTGKSVSSVSAFEGRQLVKNLEDDVTDMKAALDRLRASGVTPEPAMEGAVKRLDDAVTALKDKTAGWSDDAFDLDVNRQTIAAILGSERIHLKVTSAMGDVRDVSESLGHLGISVEPTFKPKPAP